MNDYEKTGFLFTINNNNPILRFESKFNLVPLLLTHAFICITSKHINFTRTKITTIETINWL